MGMPLIKNKNTKLELIIAQWIKEDFPHDLLAIPNCKEAVGNPDFFFPQFNGFLFIDDEIWHNLSYDFSNDKMIRNITRKLIVSDAISRIDGKMLWVFNNEIINNGQEVRDKIREFITVNLKKSAKTIGLKKIKLYESIRDAVPFWDIFNLALTRQRRGVKEYGESSFMDLDLFEEAEQELLDNIVYSYLQIVKMRTIKKKITEKGDIDNADKKL